MNGAAIGSIELVELALAFILGVVCYRAGEKRGRFDKEIDGYKETLTANRAPKHAAITPRATPPAAPILKAAGASWPATPPRSRPAVTAADIKPVIMPELGTVIPMRPEPMRDSGAGTGTMAKLTDTGWIQALKIDTNRHIAQMTAEGDAYRKELSQ